jgi:hypothetical protein
LDRYNEYNQKISDLTNKNIKLLEDKVENLKKEIPEIYFDDNQQAMIINT